MYLPFYIFLQLRELQFLFERGPLDLTTQLRPTHDTSLPYNLSVIRRIGG
jgi:hypothetical protein